MYIKELIPPPYAQYALSTLNKLKALYNYSFPVSPPVKMAMITLVNDGVIDCCLTGIYRRMLKCDYLRAKNMVNDTIKCMQQAVEVETDMMTVNKTIDALYLTLIDLAFYRYDAAHDRIRNLHFTIERKYM